MTEPEPEPQPPIVVTGVTPKGKALLDQIAAYMRDGMTQSEALAAYNEAQRSAD